MTIGNQSNDQYRTTNDQEGNEDAHNTTGTDEDANEEDANAMSEEE